MNMIESWFRIMKDQRIRFILVGAFNTAFGYGLYALFIYCGIAAHLATILMYPPSILHSYLWNKFFTFKSKERSTGEVIRFIGVYVFTFLVNVILVYMMTSICKINSFIAGVVALGIATLTSYVGHNFISFKKSKTKMEGD